MWTYIAETAENWPQKQWVDIKKRYIQNVDLHAHLKPHREWVTGLRKTRLRADEVQQDYVSLLVSNKQTNVTNNSVGQTLTNLQRLSILTSTSHGSSFLPLSLSSPFPPLPLPLHYQPVSHFGNLGLSLDLCRGCSPARIQRFCLTVANTCSKCRSFMLSLTDFVCFLLNSVLCLGPAVSMVHAPFCGPPTSDFFFSSVLSMDLGVGALPCCCHSQLLT